MFGIGSLLGKMFGTDKAVTSVVDNLSNGIDKLVYTAEEKAEDISADRSEARKMFIEWMRTTSGQNLARRIIALIVTGVWVLQYLIAMALSLISVWVTDPKKWLASAKLIGDYAEQMNGAMMLILGFYFAAPHLGKIVDGAMAKFGKRVQS
jgi:hypothetical protein